MQDAGDDFVFQFPLDTPVEPILEDPFTEMIRQQLAALLDVIVLTRNGEEVAVDGFRFINQPDGDFKVFRTPSSAS